MSKMATEKRLIEMIAERLKDAYPQADRNNLCPAIYYDDFAEIVDDVLSEIGESVDAVEVVHGRWIQSEPGYRLCSHCIADVAIYSGHRNYCPNFGSKMRGSEE